MKKLPLNELLPMVPSIVPAFKVQTLSEVTDYNHDLMNIPAAWRNSRGEGVKVAILDTGTPTHRDITVADSTSFVPGYGLDLAGHSTFCGGIIAATAGNGIGIKGIAPDCQDYYGAVLDKYGSGSTRYLIEGIYWATDVVKAQIINMSLGIPANYYVDPALEKACEYAYSKGVSLFAAAGNDSGEVNFPARFDTVIAVAAVDRKQKLADFSSRGPEVEFAAGGVDVFSTFLNNTYASMSGTSFSCPAVAAVGALIQSDFKKRTGLFLKPADLRDELRQIAYDVGPEGRDEEFGWGIPVFRKDPRVAAKPKTQSFWKWLWNKIKIG